MESRRYLTKSVFKIGRQCATKLYYHSKRDVYANRKLDDPFLQALADGGIQVGELAKCYFPEGIEVETLANEEACIQTEELLERENVTIFEAAIRFNDYLIRIDVLEKIGDRFRLIEVKAKSWNPDKDSFLAARGGIKSTWKEYIEDVAFQKMVLSRAFPNSKVGGYLMLVDKTASSPVENLCSYFQLSKDQSGRTHVRQVEDLQEEQLNPRLLIELNVDSEISQIWNEERDGFGFREDCERMARSYIDEEKIETPIHGDCGKCEYRCDVNSSQLKSGYDECLKDRLDWGEEDIREPTVFDIWNNRKKNTQIRDGKLKMSDLSENDLNVRPDQDKPLSSSERQWLQVSLATGREESLYFDKDNFRRELELLTYPLHFIDFETSAPVLPFTKGRRPYEVVAFQFSHHILHEDQSIEHKSEFLIDDQDSNSNFDFVRELKKALSNDEGSIFRYATHENSILNQIRDQLLSETEPPEDAEDLRLFIESITQPKRGDRSRPTGPRNMTDMLEWVKLYYLDSLMGGSNSIKQVLPAVLNSSAYLKDKYSDPIYGATNGTPSKNFSDWEWIKIDDKGKVQDPYKLLPPLFFENDDSKIEEMCEDLEVANGGAALVAYAKMQSVDMSEADRLALRQGLLRYCELDTLAMVMIFEGWREMISQ